MISEFTHHQTELEILCRRYHVRRLELFGSAVSSAQAETGSDVDLLVDFDPLPTGQYADAYFGLLEALESLFGRPVDLVVASAIRNPYFQDSVDRTKMLLYAA